MLVTRVNAKNKRNNLKLRIRANPSPPNPSPSRGEGNRNEIYFINRFNLPMDGLIAPALIEGKRAGVVCLACPKF